MVKAFRPLSLADALGIAADHAVIPLAGGTDLMVQRRRVAGLTPDFDEPVLFIGHLQELNRISRDASRLTIGACCTYSRLLAHPWVPTALKRVMEEIGSPAIKNRGTLGGNICNASPAGDTLTALYALDAEVILQSRGKGRSLPIEDFILGPGKTVREREELLAAVTIPRNAPSRMVYRKVGTRKANALSKLSFIGLSEISDRRLRDLRIAFGAVAPTVVRSRELEKRIQGYPPGELWGHITSICDLFGSLIRPIDDQRSTEDYRKKASLALLRQYLQGLADGLSLSREPI